jgi:hypothetical protein
MRITTKYTYVYRLIGIIGCILVLGSLFIPWLNISVGGLQGFDEGSTPTGWQLANLDKGGAWDENIFGYMFMIVYVFLILPPIGIILLAIGKEARGIGYYLIVMSIFFLVLILVMMPAIQQSIPTPPDPYEEMDPAVKANLTQEQKNTLDQQLIHRNKVLNMKRILFVPALGVILTIAGSFVTYVGARLVTRDSERLNDLYNYHILLVEAHKGQRITKEEEELLAAQRKLYKVTRSEHEMLLRRIYPNEQDFQNAVYQHDHPVDMDRMIIEKNLQDYEVFVAQAMGHGEPTKEELQMLEVIRRTLNISMDDHYMVLEYLKAEGRIKEAPPGPPKPIKRLTDVPQECLPSDEVTPRYVQSWQYKSTITRETPLAAETPVTDTTPSELSKTSLVPPAPKMDRPAKPKVGEVMGGEDIAPKAPQRPAAPPAQAPKPTAAPTSKPAPGPVVVLKPSYGTPPAPKKEQPKAPEPVEEQEVPEEKPPAPTPPPAQKPPEPAKPKSKRPTKVKCNKCGTTIPVPPSDVPVPIKCPNCGASGKV